MTTGSISTGTFPNGGTTKLHYAKAWSGGDGHTITTRYTSKPKWNNYLMASSRFRSTNPNKIGYTNNTTGTYTQRTNHAWNLGAGSDPEASGYATFGNGTISNVFPTSKFNLLWTSEQELKLLAKIIRKANGHSYDMGVSLAEVDKLAGTVLGTVKSLVFGVEDLLRFRFDRFARRFGAAPPSRKKVQDLRLLDISGRFLEMRYAWTPAIQDVFSAAEAFEAISNGPRQLYFRTAGHSQKQATLFTNYGKFSQSVQVERHYLFEMYEELGFARQLGLTNPATIIWERIPWSFVIDWFMPIGSYLSTIGQLPHMKGRWCRTSSYRASCSGALTGLTVPDSTVATPIPDCDFQVFNLERSMSVTPPNVPFPRAKVQGAVQGKRVMNALALAHQVFAKATGIGTGIKSTHYA